MDPENSNRNMTFYFKNNPCTCMYTMCGATDNCVPFGQSFNINIVNFRKIYGHLTAIDETTWEFLMNEEISGYVRAMSFRRIDEVHELSKNDLIRKFVTSNIFNVMDNLQIAPELKYGSNVGDKKISEYLFKRIQIIFPGKEVKITGILFVGWYIYKCQSKDINKYPLFTVKFKVLSQ